MITPLQLITLDIAAEEADGRLEHRCQFAMAALYKEVGLLPQDLVIPEGPRDWARAQRRSLIREWLEGPGGAYFAKVDAPAAAGDLLCFRLGGCAHHVAIQLSRGRIVHVFMPHGIKLAPCIPAPWAKRIDSIWRLK